jgi:hypothetical protein
VLYVLYAQYMARLDDPVIRQRMHAGRLQQIAEHVDRIEQDLADVRELIARIQQDVDAEPTTAADSVADLQLPRDRSVTSASWQTRPAIQDDSASL